MAHKVINLFGNLTALTIDKLDKALSDDNLAKADWNNSTQCFFNLSQVRFSQLQAVAKLTLVIARCMEKGKLPVLVALPTLGLPEKEKLIIKNKSLEERNGIRKGAESRIKANAFLKTVRFDKVLTEIAQTIPGASVLFTESFEYATSFTDDELGRSINSAFDERKLDASLRDTSNYKCIYPLTWIECRSDCNPEFQWDEQIFDDVEKILGHAEKGLDPLDVEAIKNVVLPELIKNVHEHSQQNHALLTIGLISTKTLLEKDNNDESEKRRQKRNPSGNLETPYLKWLAENQSTDERTRTQVEIYFGDTGTGLLTDNLEKKYIADRATLPNKEQATPEILMKWAYSRWAAQKTKTGADGKLLSELRSGTKGLYRIRRIIRKYAGIFHITTTNQSKNVFDAIYRDFESKKREDCWGFAKQSKQHGFSGTLIQIKMCPFVPTTHFRFVLDSEPSKIEWKFWSYALGYDESWDEVFSETCISNRIQSFQSNRFPQERSDKDYCIVFLLDLSLLKDKESLDPWRKVKEFINSKFEYFSLYGHPASIVVVLSRKTVSNGELEDQLGSLTDRLSEAMNHAQEQEQKSRDNEHYYAPVMVIGEDRKVFWFGGHKASIAFLNKVTSTLSQTNQKNLYDALYSDDSFTTEEKKRIAHVLHSDACPEWLYHFQNITPSFEEEIKQHDAKNSGLFCSPSLEITNHWFEVGSFFNDKMSNNALKYAWIFSLKVDECLRNNNSADAFDYHDAYLMIDHSQQRVLAEEFARLTGIPRANIKNLEQDIDPSVPHRGKLFPKGSNVVLLTTIISSSETARRLVKFVRRDSAHPVFLLCLYNRRQGDPIRYKKLETWGEQTEIISIVEDAQQFENKEDVARSSSLKDIRDMQRCWTVLGKHFNGDGSLKNDRPVVIKSPKHENEEPPIKESDDWEKLREWIVNAHALHYSHVGIFKSRHYTFYLDKQKLMDYTSDATKSNPGWEHLDRWINNWLNFYRISIEDVTVCIPDSFFMNGSEYSPFYQHLYSLYDKQVRVLEAGRAIRPDNLIKGNIVYIDFGMLTGETIATLANAAQSNGVKNLLVCILFKQSQSSLVRFFEHVYYLTSESSRELPIASLEAKDMPPFEQAPQLPGLLLPGFEDLQPPPRPMPPTRLAVRYLFDFPLTYFTSELCPICEHQKALEKYNIDIPYLGQFSEERQQRLKLLSMSEITQREPSDFYWTKGSIGHEMSQELIWRMFEFKCMLENAEKNTHARIRLFNYLHDIYEKRALLYRDPDSDLYAVLFFLAHEVYWFQREPLTHKKIRVLLTDISQIVAVCKLSKLVNFFNETQLQRASSDSHFEETSQKQATRYKYAAISAIRSANKMRFCRAVRVMLKSVIRSPITAIKEEGSDDESTKPAFSNNLVQNIFYHIASLCQNTYNSSMNYFRVLEIKLPDEEIRGIGTCAFSFEQQIAGSGIRSHIQMAKRRIDDAGKSASNFADIKKLNKIFDECAKQPHPEPCADLYRYSLNPSIVAWRSVMRFIESVLWYAKRNSLISLPARLTTILPETFWSEAEELLKATNEMALKRAENNVDASDDISLSRNLKKLNDYFIRLDGKYRSNEDSMVKQWVDNMISDFGQTIDEVFPNAVFSKRKCHGLKGVKVFFPQISLQRNLSHIREHIDRQLERTNTFPHDFDLEIVVSWQEREMVEFIIRYNSSAEDSSFHNGHRGGLSAWREDIILFGGLLDYERPTSTDKHFTIKMRFQRYE